MSYTPTNWQTGDTITAEKLNNMEDGIEANAGYWIPVEYSGGVFSVPANKETEVLNALLSPGTVFLRGVCLSGQVYYPGYCVSDGAYECRLTKEMMVENGYSSAGKMFISPRQGGGIDVEIVPDIFIITFTPTAQDFSGTMDKTVGEINAAYEAGQKIVFRMVTSATGYMDVDCTYRGNDDLAYPSFNASAVINSPFDAFVFLYTLTTDDGTKNTYSTTIYPLTPMS